MRFKYDICIVGGAGHIGLPLGLVFAKKNKKVILYDTNLKNLNLVKKKHIPFLEFGAQKVLKRYYKNLFFTNNRKYLSKAKIIIICIGTPISQNLLPQKKNFLDFFKFLKKFINKDQLIIIRSSVYPGVCHEIYKILNNFNNLSYCPERIVQGFALKELPKLPQVVSAFSSNARVKSANLFRLICKNIIFCDVLEAELIKLFSNAYRYINFSISNQFYMMCKNLNLDFNKIRKMMIQGYERNTNIPKSGFTAGPCLLKDTIQLSHFFKHKFPLGKSAMIINEGLPKFLITNLKKTINLKTKTIGVMGLAFKAETDDLRDSLSVKLVEYLKKNKYKFYISDEYYKGEEIVSKKKLIQKSDIIIIATPHKSYKKIKFPKEKIVIDIWGIYKK